MLKKLRFVETIADRMLIGDTFPSGIVLKSNCPAIRDFAAQVAGDYKDISKYIEISLEIEVEHMTDGYDVYISLYGVREESDEELKSREDKELDQLKELIARHPEEAKKLIHD